MSLEVANYSKTMLIVKLLEPSQREMFDEAFRKLDGKWKQGKFGEGWVIHKKHQDQIDKIIDEGVSDSEDEKDKKSDSEDENSSDEEVVEDDSDDELVQEVLIRKLKSQSTGKVIEELEVENSDDEDVITLARRMRNIYIQLKEINTKLDKLLNITN